MDKEKIALIDVGGGMRDIYGAGVTDFLMDNKIRFPYLVGVSAGSANLASYLSNQRGRNKVFYTEYAFEKEYMSVDNLFKKGSFVDLDYVYGTLSNDDGRYPWDYDKAMKDKAEFVVVATDAETGKPVYYYKKDYKINDYGMLKGSSCVPLACKAYKWHDKYLYDGGVSDPIPLERAFKDGCDRAVIILTRPEGFRKSTKHAGQFTKLKKTFPNMVEKLYSRCDIYNRQLDYIEENFVENDKVLIVAPDDVCGIDTLKMKKENLLKLYDKGYKDGEKIKEWLDKIKK